VQDDLEGRSRPIADVSDEPAAPSTWEIVKSWLRESFRGWRPKPIRLKIAGIEVVQAVQHFNLTGVDQEGNNSTPLVARKRTMVRVYVDSGMVAVGELPNVTGSVKRSSALAGDGDDASAGRIVGFIKDLVGIGGQSLVNPGPPINENEVVTARPLGKINRNNLGDSLNFVLPVEELSGRIRLTAEVHLKAGVLGLLLPRARASTVIEFHERRLPGKLVHILVDTYMAPAPPLMSYYRYCLDQVIAMFPAPDADFFPLYQLPGYETIENDTDLSQDWGQLADQLNQIEAEFNMDGYILTALLSPLWSSAWRGRDFKTDVVGLEFGPVVFADPQTFPHELGHRFGLRHAGDGNPELEGDGDSRIPVLTDEPGIDMSKRVLVPAGSSETMVYMTSSTSWFSTATWQILFDSFAV
jgi:hypothetical protein